VPICYLTSFRRLIDTSGPQDAEQNIFGQLAFRIDEADHLTMRAPRQTLICTGTRDATFDISNAWDVFHEAKRFYSRLGHAEQVEMHEADAPHGFGIQQREVADEAKRFYSRLGHAEQVEMHEADAPHGFGIQQREFAAGWLLGSDKAIREFQTLSDPFTDKHSREPSKCDWRPVLNWLNRGLASSG